MIGGNCLGITQINIKINQTNQMNGGKPKIVSNSGATVNPFDQVLAMFNLPSQFSVKAGQVNRLSMQMQNGSDQMGNIPPELLMFNQVSDEETLEPMIVDAAQSDLEGNSTGEQDYVDLNLNVDNLMSILSMLSSNFGINNTLKLEDNQPSIVDLNNAEETQSSFFITDEAKSYFNEEETHLSRIQDHINGTGDIVNPDDYKENKQLESLKLTNESIADIESILTVLLNEIKSQGPIRFTTGTNPSEDGPHTSEESNMANPLSNTRPEIDNVLAQGPELVKKMEKPSAIDSSQLLHKVTQVLEEIQQFQGKRITPEIPADFKEKIQIILNGIKAAQKSGTFFVPNSQDPTSDAEQNELPKFTPGFSLDKNQVIHSVLPHIGKSEQVYNRFSKAPSASSIDDFTKVNGQLTSLNHVQHVSGNDLQELNLPPSMDVTNFAPEVSEWINRFMKITNGKSGSAEAKFSLFPEHLGHIEIKVTTHQGQISAQIVTDTTMAKDALEGQLQHLKQSLQQSGLHVQKLDVVQQTSVTTDSSQNGLAFSQDGSHSSREHRSYTASPNNRNEQNEFSDQNEHNGEIQPITYGGTAQKTSSRIDFTA